MWLSKRFNKAEPAFSETAVVTASGSEKTEATSSLCAKNVTAYAPYGYSCSIPLGQEVLLIHDKSGVSGTGVKMENADGLSSGEIMIKSLGGASLCLKNDGSVVINGCITITNDGVLINRLGEVIIL